MIGPPGSFCIGEGSGIFAEIALAENRRSPLPLPFSEQYLWKALPAALSSYRRIQALSGKSRHPRTYRTSQAVGTKQAGQAERTNLSIPGCAPANRKNCESRAKRAWREIRCSPDLPNKSGKPNTLRKTDRTTPTK